jgi:hypothetical protein
LDFGFPGYWTGTKTYWTAFKDNVLAFSFGIGFGLMLYQSTSASKLHWQGLSAKSRTARFVFVVASYFPSHSSNWNIVEVRANKKAG